ncbi:MAG: cyclic nucleotide-binding domain-containing protein [Acidobacteriaceae bacterium]
MADGLYSNLFLFRELLPNQLELLYPLFIPCEFLADSLLFEQGDPAENLFAVVSGEVVVNFKPDDGPAITVARVQPGSIVGWSAALGSKRYTSSATCTTYTELLRVRGDDLRRLCLQHPETGTAFLDRLATVIAERLHSTHDLVLSLLQLGLAATIEKNGG